MHAASPSLLASARAIAADIKFAHSVFALPFALLAAFMAAIPAAPPAPSDFWPAFLPKLILIILCMVLARTLAMLANRFLDRRIDALNPRTAARALPSGIISPASTLLLITLCAIAFFLATSLFGFLFRNWLPLLLSLPVLAWLAAYGLLKRFTALCHLYLGTALALSPIAAAIAINPASILPASHLFQLSIPLLSLMVLAWVAGFDIIYALQDVEIDRAQNLHSLPARLGIPRALLLSRALHALAFLSLLAICVFDPRFAWPFLLGILITGFLLLYEHLTVARWGRSRIALAFFTLNGIISCLLGSLGIFDLLLPSSLTGSLFQKVLP